MNATKTQPAPEPDADTQGSNDPKREVSKIAFPYDDLDAAVEIARAIYQLTGSESEIEQIAGHLKQSPKSSGLRIQISSAKTFGLTINTQGKVTLTPLGTRICDPQQEKSARVDAFLTVPLYKEIYEKFRGVSLPPDGALETTIASMGVAPKQKERARQIFRRSAQEAGFFQFGTDRLILPAIKAGAGGAPLSAAGAESEEPRESSDMSGRGKTKSSGGGGSELDPFIQGLLTKLPPPDSEWPIEGRLKWLQTAAHIFDLIYKDTDDSQSIDIATKKNSAK